MTDRRLSSSMPMNRRRFVTSAVIVAGSLAGGRWLVTARAAASSTPGSAPPAAAAGGLLTIENFAATGRSTGLVKIGKLVKSDVEWRTQLAPLAYRVTRRADTEAPFSGEYAESRADGLYRCVCCATALFDSTTKFDSGTGWPSFWQPISPHNVSSNADSSFGMQRDAVACARCDAHLGHVFDDGPRPTGLRYCMNSVSLAFVPRAS